MKIKNIGKFRDELFAAIKDAAYWDAEVTFCTAKSKYCDRYYERMKHDAEDSLPPDEDWNFIPTIGGDDENYGVVGLPHPMHFSGTDIYMIIDCDGNARFYKDVITHFECVRIATLEYYSTRMASAMVLIRAIDEVVKENRR